MTALERLKKQFEEFRGATIVELMGTDRPKATDQTRLTKIEQRLDAIEAWLKLPWWKRIWRQYE